MGYVQLTEVRRYGHYVRGVLRSRNRTGRHFRPQDDWWNATETVDLSLGAINAPPPSPLLEQKQRKLMHHPPAPSLNKSKGGE